METIVSDIEMEASKGYTTLTVDLDSPYKTIICNKLELLGYQIGHGPRNIKHINW
jgi:hypothetical protein